MKATSAVAEWKLPSIDKNFGAAAGGLQTVRTHSFFPGRTLHHGFRHFSRKPPRLEFSIPLASTMDIKERQGIIESTIDFMARRGLGICSHEGSRLSYDEHCY